MKLYRPSNGTEGDLFMARWCRLCKKDHPTEGCEILMRSMLHWKDEPGYPTEWRYRKEKDQTEHPVCTAFEERAKQ